MKVISVIYMSRRNFWCMSRGDSWHLNFQLQKVDWEPSGRQNWGQMMEFWKILYIHFIRDPKGITYVRLILKIESDAKMAVPNVNMKIKPTKFQKSKIEYIFNFLFPEKSSYFRNVLVGGELLVCLKFASNLNFKMNPPQNCSLLVPYEVYIKLFSKIQCFHPVLASWLSSIHLLEMKFFLRWTPPCHASKVVSWHVDWGYEPHFWSYLGKILNYSWKTCKKSWFVRYCQFLPVLGL